MWIAILKRDVDRVIAVTCFMPLAMMKVPICFYILRGHFARGVDVTLRTGLYNEAISYI